MQKVKFLTDYPFSIGYGGKEIQLTTYCEEFLDNSTYEADFLNYWDKGALDDCSILHVFGYSTWYRSILNNLKIKRPDIKIVLSPNFYRGDAFFYKIGHRIFSKFPVRNYFSELNILFNSLDGIIFNSTAEAFQHKEIFKSKSSYFIIKNGIEDNFAIINNPLQEGNKRAPSYKYALSVGFFDERKNSIRLLESFLATSNSHDLNLVLVGEPRFTSDRNQKLFLRLIEENASRIIYLGFIDRKDAFLKTLYANCCFHILPSLFETPGISSLEALSFGKPVVVGDCPPVREYFANNAIYCKPTSNESISSSILAAINCKKIYKLPQELLFSNIRNQLISCYDSLLKQKSK